MARQERRGSLRPGILTRKRKTTPIPVFAFSCVLALVAALPFLSSSGYAQTTDVEDVHIAPAPIKPPQENVSQDTVRTHAATIRAKWTWCWFP